MKKVRIGIIGSRTFDDYNMMRNSVDDLISSKGYEEITIVSGGARGADKLGERYADEKEFEKLIFLPNWDLYGKVAGNLRNTEIVANSDILCAFWDGISTGTTDSIKKAREKGIETHVFRFEKMTTEKFDVIKFLKEKRAKKP